MKYFKILVVAILLISLVINFRLLSRMSDVENQINTISNNQMQIMNSVNNQSSNIYNAMENFKREQSWISAIQMDVDLDSLEKRKTTLSFEWQVKELLKNSQVVFHYKFGEDKDYSSVPAVEVENGLFEVNIPIEVQLEPEWHINIATNNREKEAERIIEEEKMRNNSNDQLSYYVTVSNDDLVKSGEINTTHIDYLGTSYYGVLKIFGDIYDGGFDISVMAPPSYNDNNIFLKEAYLMKYKNGKLVEEEKLISNDVNDAKDMPIREHSIGFHKNSSNEEFDYTSLVLKTVFSDGEAFEREVFRK